MKIMKHPLNWVIVTFVVLLGAFYIHHVNMATSAVVGKVKAGKARSPANAGSADPATGGSFNA